MNRAYSRCSTNESKQDINRQVRELKAAGAEVIYMEYEHIQCQWVRYCPGSKAITTQQRQHYTTVYRH